MLLIVRDRSVPTCIPDNPRSISQTDAATWCILTRLICESDKFLQFSFLRRVACREHDFPRGFLRGSSYVRPLVHTDSPKF